MSYFSIKFLSGDDEVDPDTSIYGLWYVCFHTKSGYFKWDLQGYYTEDAAKKALQMYKEMRDLNP